MVSFGFGFGLLGILAQVPRFPPPDPPPTSQAHTRMPLILLLHIKNQLPYKEWQDCCREPKNYASAALKPSRDDL